jgi:predicted Zn-dependent peptidase
MQTALGRARLLGQYEIFDGNPGLINIELEKFLAVKSGDIQAVAKRYLAADRRSVLQIVPAPKPASSGKESQ